MRGIDVLKNVYLIIDEEIPKDSLVRTEQIGFINHILADLDINRRITDLNEEIKVSDKLFSAVVYGTAMLLTAAKGDSVRQQYFSELYNLKRSLTGCSDVRQDRIPVSLW